MLESAWFYRGLDSFKPGESGSHWSSLLFVSVKFKGVVAEDCHAELSLVVAFLI